MVERVSCNGFDAGEGADCGLGEGMLPEKLWEKVLGDEYEVLKTWVEDLTARPSFQVSAVLEAEGRGGEES